MNSLLCSLRSAHGHFIADAERFFEVFFVCMQFVQKLNGGQGLGGKSI